MIVDMLSFDLFIFYAFTMDHYELYLFVCLVIISWCMVLYGISRLDFHFRCVIDEHSLEYR